MTNLLTGHEDFIVSHTRKEIIRSDGLHLGDYCCGGNGDIDCQSWCDYPSEEEIQDDSVVAWKEFDTYKVGTVSNSTSTMHKLASTPITMVEPYDCACEDYKSDKKESKR